MELERLNERARRYNQRVVLMRAAYQKPTRLAIVSDEDGRVLKDGLTFEGVNKWYDALDGNAREFEYIRDQVIDAVNDEFHFDGEDVLNSVTLAEMFADIDMAIASVFDAWHAADIRDVIKDCARAARKAFRRSEFAPYLKEEIIAAGSEKLYDCVVREFENVLEVRRSREKNFLDKLGSDQ